MYYLVLSSDLLSNTMKNEKMLISDDEVQRELNVASNV